MEHNSGSKPPDCWMIVWSLVVTTHAAAKDDDAPDDDGTAAHDDHHQQFIKINTIYINYRMSSLEIITRKLRQCIP